jgi:hypothetical protein
MPPTIERICPNCRASQHLDALYCNVCGSAIERYLPQPVSRLLPARIRQQLAHPIVRSVAMGALMMIVQVVIRTVQHNLSTTASRALTKSPTNSRSDAKQTTVQARRTFWQKTSRDGTIRSDEHITWKRTDQ